MRNIYVEILDVLTTRQQYLEDSNPASRPDRDIRLSELKVVRAIINTLKNQEEE